jgi:hypothetical protein
LQLLLLFDKILEQQGHAALDNHAKLNVIEQWDVETFLQLLIANSRGNGVKVADKVIELNKYLCSVPLVLFVFVYCIYVTHV